MDETADDAERQRVMFETRISQLETRHSDDQAMMAYVSDVGARRELEQQVDHLKAALIGARRIVAVIGITMAATRLTAATRSAY